MSASIVSVIEQLLVAQHREEAGEMMRSVRAIDSQITRILRYVDVAITRAGDDTLLRADLEEIRAAAMRAVTKTELIGISSVDDAA